MGLGDSAAMVRLLSALVGILTSPVTYLLGRRLMGRRVGAAGCFHPGAFAVSYSLCSGNAYVHNRSCVFAPAITRSQGLDKRTNPMDEEQNSFVKYFINKAIYPHLPGLKTTFIKKIGLF
jgi:hypothetical protein